MTEVVLELVMEVELGCGQQSRLGVGVVLGMAAVMEVVTREGETRG